MLQKLFSGSWKTSIAGIVLGLSILFAQMNNLLDSDPLTAFDWKTVMEALAAMGLGFAARDNGVTSEQAGVKP